MMKMLHCTNRVKLVISTSSVVLRCCARIHVYSSHLLTCNVRMEHSDTALLHMLMAVAVLLMCS